MRASASATRCSMPPVRMRRDAKFLLDSKRDMLESALVDVCYLMFHYDCAIDS